MTDWDGSAKKKYGHLAPPGYFEAIIEDAGRYERGRVARMTKMARWRGGVGKQFYIHLSSLM